MLVARTSCVVLALALCSCCCHGALAEDPIGDLSKVKMQPGFRISAYSKGKLPKARALAISGASKSGGPVIIYVSTGKDKAGGGKVYALVDKTGSATAVSTVTLLSGLDTPAGIDWHKGSLYISHFLKSGKGAISRLDDIDSYALQGKAYTGKLVLLTDQLPTDRSHALHHIRMHPNGKQIYVAQGTPCNICVPLKLPGVAQFNTLMTLDLGTKQLQIYASGIRNTVGFDWHPDTGVLHFTDNGRDQMTKDGGKSNDRPDCELNAAPKPQLFFGFPYCQAKGRGSPYLRDAGSVQSDFWNDPDTNLNGKVRDCKGQYSHIRPLQPLGPHVAPLGMRFYRRDAAAKAAFPGRYDRAAFIALHGSWNRAPKNGYKVVVVRTDSSGKVLSYENFASFLINEGAMNKDPIVGRPVDVQQLPDGSLLMSDDEAGAVYRITYQPPSTAQSLEDGTSAQAAGSIGSAPGSTAGAQQSPATAAMPVNGAAPLSGGMGWMGMLWRLVATALMAVAVALM